jgi:hypothetical protein
MMRAFKKLLGLLLKLKCDNFHIGLLPDADVPMISVDGGAGLVQPYMAPSFVAQPSSYLAYPK